MIKTVLIDDEADALDVLEWQLQTYCSEVEVVARCTSANEGILAISNHRPSLVFLDIEMPGKNGFAVVQAFHEPFFNFVFTTAYNQFAVEAFKAAALDYLLKPIDAEDLLRAVQRHCKRQQGQALQQQLSLLLQHYQQSPLPDKLSFSTQDAIHFVAPADILYAESSSNYTILLFAGGARMVVSKTLKEVEEMLRPYQFYRIHHSYVVNLTQVSRYVKVDGGGIEMINGHQLPVSRQKKDEIVRLLTHASH
jgi:two-component system LytT family response regulator